MNYRTTHAFNSLRDIVDAVSYRTKYASDGMNSSMPDDPSGNGFRAPKTGPQFTEYTDDYSHTNPFTPNVGEGGEPSLTAENQQENSNSDFDIYVSGDGPDGQNTCKTTKDDPGTSMPAEAGEEKYSAYLNYSMEENIDGFNKCASLWLGMYRDDMEKSAGYEVLDASEYPFTKQAMDSNMPAEIVEELAGLETTPLHVREKLASMSNYELAALIQACDNALANKDFVKQAEAAVLNGLTVNEYNTLNSINPQSLIKLAADAEEAADMAAVAAANDEVPTPAEADALQGLDSNDVGILNSLEPGDLDELTKDAAAAAELEANAGDAEEAFESNPEIAEEAEAIDSLPEETVDKLASLSPEMLQQYMQKLAEDIEAIDALPDDPAEQEAVLNNAAVADAVESGEATPEEAAAVIPDEEIAKVASLSPRMYRYYMQKAAEEVDAAQLQAVLDELPPDVAEELVNMSPEELQEVIEAANDSEAGDDEAEASPQLLEQMAGENGSSEGEAMNDLSSAMTEEGVTPEELAEMGKQGSWQFQRELVKLAAAVKAYRDAGLYHYRRPRTTKEAYARAQMHSFLNEIR